MCGTRDKHGRQRWSEWKRQDKLFRTSTAAGREWISSHNYDDDDDGCSGGGGSQAADLLVPLSLSLSHFFGLCVSVNVCQSVQLWPDDDDDVAVEANSALHTHS